MSGLAHLFEQHGIATTVISLVRLHSEKVAPPRSLFVPFDFGRPFGPANDAVFQRRVIEHALGLLDRDSGPVLEDFPEEEPETAGEEMGWSCPVRFAAPKEDLTGVAAIEQTLLGEIAEMKPWYEQALSSRGRTTVSSASAPIEATATLLASMFNDTLPPSPDADRSLADALRIRAEDLKAFMLESASVQPGNPSAAQLNDWFWNETKTADILRELREVCVAHDDPQVQIFGNLLLVPWARLGEVDLSAVPG